MIACIFDTETTGLVESRLMRLERQPHVIEVCFLMTDLRDGTILEEFSTFIKPPRRDLLSDKIIGITGIQWSDLANAPSFVEVASRIKKFIVESPVVIAHNLSFDKEVLEIEFKRLGDKIQWPAMQFCTVEQTRHMKGHNMNLSMLHETLVGYVFEDAHRATVDTRALVRCAVEMHKRGFIA
jgi:DNA polymerase III epsilon subunit-like protein